MKKIIILFAVTNLLGLFSCKKQDIQDTTLTTSATEATVGQSVLLQVSTTKNAVSWTVTPTISALKQFTITTQKTNSIIFTQPGVYSIGVRARDILYDSARHQNIDSCWHNGGGDRGGCTRGKDSASVSIKVS